MGSLKTQALQPMFGYFCLAVEKCNRVETVLVPSVFLHLSLYMEESFTKQKPEKNKKVMCLPNTTLLIIAKLINTPLPDLQNICDLWF